MAVANGGFSETNADITKAFDFIKYSSVFLGVQNRVKCKNLCTNSRYCYGTSQGITHFLFSLPHYICGTAPLDFE